jgi:hypothetical protein
VGGATSSRSDSDACQKRKASVAIHLQVNTLRALSLSLSLSLQDTGYSAIDIALCDQACRSVELEYKVDSMVNMLDHGEDGTVIQSADYGGGADMLYAGCMSVVGELP